MFDINRFYTSQFKHIQKEQQQDLSLKKEDDSTSLEFDDTVDGKSHSTATVSDYPMPTESGFQQYADDKR